MSKSIKIKTQVVFNKNVMYFLYPVIVIVAKIMRYIVFRESILLRGMGWGMLPEILNGTVGFDALWQGSGAATIAFFRLFNIFHLTTYEQFEAAITLVYSGILFLLLMRSKRTFTLYQLLMTCAIAALLNIYSFCLSKEPVQILYFLAMYLVIMSPGLSERQKDIALLLLWLFSAATFRQYYIMGVGFYFLLRVADTGMRRHTQKKLSKKKIALLLVLMGAAYYCLLLLVRRVSMDAYLELLFARSQERGVGIDMNTRIVPLFPTDSLYYYPLNYVTTIIRLLFPLELIRLAPRGAQYIIFLVYQLMLTYTVLTCLRNVKQNPLYKNLALYTYLAYLFTAAAAELDFGTWTRHETALFPLYFVLLDLIKIKERKYRSHSSRDTRRPAASPVNGFGSKWTAMEK